MYSLRRLARLHASFDPASCHSHAPSDRPRGGDHTDPLPISEPLLPTRPGRTDRSHFAPLDSLGLVVRVKRDLDDWSPLGR
jgi:hypothetical protein